MPRTSARLARASFNSAGPKDQTSVETASLFVYGTLMLDEVILILLDRIPDYQLVEAAGWLTARIPEKVYPGLVRSDSHVAYGRVYTDLTVEEWILLDRFEDSVYNLMPIEVSLKGVRPLAYVWDGESARMQWRITDLNKQQISLYLNRCATWKDRYRRCGP